MNRIEVLHWIQNHIPHKGAAGGAAQMRSQILSWMREHREELASDDAEGMLDRCEERVREKTRDWVWPQAAQIAERRATNWEGRWGQHGGDRFVAGEICHALAEELKGTEPSLERVEDVWPEGEDVFEGGAPRLQALIRSWGLEIGRRETHRLWREIVHSTKHRGPSLAEERGFADEHEWEGTHNYAEIASTVTHLLAREFDARVLH